MHSYIKPLVKLFKENVNQSNAEPMAKYMKNLFPYMGIKTPKRKELFKDFVKEYNLPKISELKQITLDLWELPEREFQYIAIGLLKKYTNKWDEDDYEWNSTLLKSILEEWGKL
ncbi:MAG: DNA alkylation repair protein [Candidatus Cloacimonadota bacterium]|nr:DNA alkylation repair protein [Candidatus Cloacimonadota bacterium]